MAAGRRHAESFCRKWGNWAFYHKDTSATPPYLTAHSIFKNLQLTFIGLVSPQGKMIMQDKLEKERNDAKNYVEEYVYDMRDKLHGRLEKFVSETVRKLTSVL